MRAIGQEGHLKSELGLNLSSATISSVIVVKLFKFQVRYLSMEKVIFVMPGHRVVYGLYGKKCVCNSFVNCKSLPMQDSISLLVNLFITHPSTPIIPDKQKVFAQS